MATLFEILNLHTLITCILFCVIGIVGLVGNLLMIRAWLKYRKLRTDFYTVFTFLGIADIMFLLINVPTQIIDQIDLEGTMSTNDWCKASNYLINVCGFIAAYLIVVLSVLRGILLTNRNSISRPQAKHLLVVCILFYIVASLSSVPIINMYLAFDGYCQFVLQTDPIREVWLINSFASVVPLFLVLIIYLFTYLLGKRFFADSYSPREKEKSRLVTIIIIAFVICQLPYRIIAIYDVHVPPTSLEEVRNIFTAKGYLMCLLMTDKAIRPILYSKLASDLSDAFDEVINCKSCSKSYTAPPTLVSRRGHNFTPTIVSSTCHNNANGVCDALWANASSDNNLTDNTDRTLSTSVEGSFSERTVSTSSSASANSQTPLTKQREEVDIEMV